MASVADSKPTKLVFQYDEKLRSLLSRVTAVRKYAELADPEKALFKSGNDATFAIGTAETIFYAQGGGQPFDIGVIKAKSVNGKHVKFEVQAVRKGLEDKILHFGVFEGTNEEALLSEGDMVEQEIDGARRDSNSKSHTAGHVVGLSVRRLVEKNTDLDVSELKAQHYPEASFVEFKGLIDGKHKDAIQEGASAYVARSLPIKLHWYQPEDLAANGVLTPGDMPVVAGSDGKVRVVDIVGAGAYPCGGTHVPDTSHVGEITIRGIKRQKGNSRISYSISEKA